MILAVIGIPVYVYIPKFYTDVVGINVAILGYLLFSVRIFDAVTDPVIGYLSDRTKTRFGRRRPYIALGAILVVVMMFLLFNPPPGSPSFKTVWFGFTIYALFLSWTIATVPYESLGPEITFNYHERTSLFGMAGYTPNIEQTEDVQLVLRSLYALVPSLCNLVGIVIAIAYPINDTIHEQIREAIEIRKQEKPVADPLHPDEMLD